ncbi:Uma2 family endonuclease [Candidatus Oscillochloris fontis]|uniref:Uma2 family endonuclease n=1 Tax=Candidatus Oscillochloris fontis TaxID=2496868 RepID=UPI00101B8C7B|nr:Uma2 family endonuclease [Candidatus Oscillochloris fontis]
MVTTKQALNPELRIVDQHNQLIIDFDQLQGHWSEEMYLRLTDHTKRMIEFTDGYLDVLPMPTRKHQAISLFLLLKLLAYIRPLGVVYYAPLRLQIRAGKFREPDLLVLRDAHDPRNQNSYWLGADLVVEIVSPDAPDRDLIQKVNDYAEAGIPEYWIVNPVVETITVLRLEGTAYLNHGVFGRDEVATSVLLTGFAVEVSTVLDAE